jgi:hypothetical protein
VSLARVFVVFATIWSVGVSVALTARALFVSVPFAPTEGLIWLFAGLGPVAVFFSIYRGASSSTIACVLYDAEHAGDEKVRLQNGRS